MMYNEFLSMSGKDESLRQQMIKHDIWHIST